MQHIHFGFSYIGLLFLLMLCIPNLIWIKYRPIDDGLYAMKENCSLKWFERIGQITVSCLVLIFDDFNINEINVWTLWLLFAFIFMVLYEIFWIRYFKSPRTLKDFYRSILGIPVAGATLPILSFICLSIYGKNIFLLFATLILGVGHIGIHILHYKELRKSSKS